MDEVAVVDGTGLAFETFLALGADVDDRAEALEVLDRDHLGADEPRFTTSEWNDSNPAHRNHHPIPSTQRTTFFETKSLIRMASRDTSQKNSARA